ncbi:MAG: tyrosine-type recombinase/integrase [bacterium]
MRLYKRGNIWWCEFRADKKHYQHSCKTKDKKLAEEVAAALQADIVRNKFDIPAKFKVVKSFLDTWKEYLKNLNNSKKTIEDKNDNSKHFLNIFENKNITGIQLEHIKTYQLQRKFEILSLPKNISKKESEISFRSVNIEISTLNHFFNFCIEKGYIDKNPATGIKKLNELSRLKTLSDSDIQKLIAGATNKLTRDLITFLIYTGCRKGEALNLKWDNVDLQNNVIAIKGTKTKYDRYIPIHTQLKELLSGIKKNQDCLYLFNDNGRKLGDFRRSFKTACRNAGLKDMRIHDLRHVFASKMVMNGTSLYITGELLGHRTTQMTKRYSHLVPETLRKAVEDVFNKEK